MRTETVRITPDMAKNWLKKNRTNRPVSQMIVANYADDMRRKDWQLTGDAIRFARSGELIDGQHRLMACVLSGAEFTSLVIRGLADSAFNKLDQGYKRTVSHAFSRAGKKNANHLAAACRIVSVLASGQCSSINQRFSIERAFEVLQQYPRIEINVQTLMSMRNPSAPMTISELAGYLSFTETRHGQRAHDFWKAILTGEELKRGSAALLLHRALMESIVGGRALSRPARFAYIVKAYNGHITGKVPRLLKWTYGDAVPEFVS